MRLKLHLLVAWVTLAFAAPALASSTTGRSDNLRTGWYPDQAALSPQTVGGSQFGQLFATAVSGQVYAQPLVSRGTLFVATEANSIYGLDPVSGAKQWSRALEPPWNPSDLTCTDLAPQIGVTGTPVIDSETNIAYFFAKSYLSGTSGPASWKAHAVDVATGNERPGFPVSIAGNAQNASGRRFDPTHEMQRPGLLLIDGVVYAGFGGHCDHGDYQGWIAGVATNGTLRALWVSLGGSGGVGAGIWQSGGGIVSDRPGSLVFTTGNGGSPTPPIAGTSPPPSLGESVVRLNVQPDGSLQAADFFSPYDAATLDRWDTDLGSAAPAALPPQQFGTSKYPNLIVTAGKEGYVYLLNADDLGGIGTGPSGSDRVLARIGPYGGVWSSPAVWPGDGGYVYMPTGSGGLDGSGTNGLLRVYHYGQDGSGSPALSLAASSSDAYGALGSSAPIVTSDGTTSGTALVWIVWSPSASGVGAQLRAYDAVPSAGRPTLRFSAPIGSASKFNPPGVAGGRVYVGTRDGQVLGFGSPTTAVLGGSAMSFPQTTVGASKTQVETLTASKPITVSSVSATDPQFAAGPTEPPLPADLPTGGTLKVPVTFAPAHVGPAAGSLRTQTSAGQVEVALSGSGLAPSAKLTATPSALSLGGVPVGRQVGASVVLQNAGAQPLHIGDSSTPSVTGPFAATGVPTPGATLGPGQSVTVGVTYSPTAEGPASDQMTIASDGGSVTVKLSGTATAPAHLTIAPISIDYGTVLSGSISSRSFAVQNTGGSALVLTRSKPPAAGAFTATSPLDEGTTIWPGGSVTVSVGFAPSAAGDYSDHWDLTANDGSGPQVVTLSGSAASPIKDAPPPPAASPPAATVTTAAAVGPVLTAPIGLVGPQPSSLTLLRVHPARLRSGSRPLFEYTLTTRARVRIRVDRAIACPHRRHACTRWVPVAHLELKGKAGANRWRVTTRSAGRWLAPGRYRVLAEPTLPWWASAHILTASFEIVR